MHLLSLIQWNIIFTNEIKKITEYHPSQSGENVPEMTTLDTDYSLKFCFVRGYRNASTFGKDKNIF